MCRRRCWRCRRRSCRCWSCRWGRRRRGCLVSERAREFGYGPIDAVKRASGNMHGIEALHHRRGIEVEHDGHVPVL